MASNSDNFDDFFNDDDDFFSEDTAFGDFSSDDALLDDGDFEEEQTGTNRTFIIAAVFLGVVFIILLAVVAVVVLSSSGGCNENCILATEISATNAQIQADIRSSETAQSEQGTATQIAVETLSSESTSTAIVQSTATADAQNTQVAATETQQSVDATSTQISAERTATAEFAATQTANAPTATETAQVAQEQRGRLEGDLAREGITICIFRDNGDGEFNPSTDVGNPNCSPEIVASAPEEESGTDTTDVIGEGGAGEDTTDAGTDTTGESFIAGTATAMAASETGEDTTDAGGDAPTEAPLNAIFQTATAAAANRGGLSTPTPEGSSFNPATRGKAIIPDDDSKSAPKQEGDEDPFETFIITEENGEFVIPELPPGEYWIGIGDQQLQIRVQDTVGDQVFTFPGDGGTIVIRVEGVGGSSPTPDTDSPIFERATQLAQTQTAEASGSNPETQTAAATMPDSGLFDGEGGDVTGTDLLILGIMGMALLAVIFVMRSARGALSA